MKNIFAITPSNVRRILLVVGALASFLGLAPTETFAAAADYKIEVAEQTVKAGKPASFSVRITKASDGAAVSGAKIGEAKLHMPMGKMDMPAPVKFEEKEDKGLYLFNGELTMYGEWVLDLTVTPPGESAPIQVSLKFRVVK